MYVINRNDYIPPDFSPVTIHMTKAEAKALRQFLLLASSERLFYIDAKINAFASVLSHVMALAEVTGRVDSPYPGLSVQLEDVSSKL